MNEEEPIRKWKIQKASDGIEIFIYVPISRLVFNSLFRWTINSRTQPQRARSFHSRIHIANWEPRFIVRLLPEEDLSFGEVARVRNTPARM
ncbi:unnamed protein product, partial [Nesidiocoris tenuis]